jgi:SAM-dependent methyltransferase
MADDETCPLCGSEDVEIFSVPYPLFEHREFDVIHDGPSALGRCRDCLMVFRNDGDAVAATIDGIYRRKEYVTRNEPLHTVYATESGGLKTMPFLQAELLAPFIPGQNAAVLDIGCFDGRLLRELAGRHGDAGLCGFDVSEETRSRFPEGGNFRFVSGSLAEVTGSFDLIVLSHSIQYIRDLGELFGQVSRLLKPGGVVFVQVPDLDRRATSLLFGDLHFHFTQAVLENMFANFSFSCSFLDNRWFPRDLLAIGKAGKADRAETQPVTRDDAAVEQALDYLEAMTGKLEGLSQGTRTGVLGTTVDAAFVNSVLGERAAFFVEENEKKIGATFHGKPVLSPADVSATDRVILPMGEAGEALSSRLSGAYEGEYICV